jgi:uroporphyrinogen-III synthase
MDDILYYIFDQSSISNMDNFPPYYQEFTIYWDVLEDLVQRGAFLIPEEVYNESKRSPPEIRNWIEQNKDAIIFETPGMYDQLSKILEKHPRIGYKNLKMTKKYHADPHLIALAKDLQEMGKKVLIITDEKSGPHQIPTVAQDYGIKCLTLYGLFEKLGILKRN